MDTTTKSPLMIYTEQTPNPESLKFVTNKMLFRGTADFEDAAQAGEWSPLGAVLFAGRLLGAHRRRRLKGSPLDTGVFPALAENVVRADVAILHARRDARIAPAPFRFQVDEFLRLLLV